MAAEVDTETAEFLSAAIENTENLLSVCGSFQNLEEFLKSSEVRIPLHAVKIAQPELQLNYDFDIDGVLLELKSVTAIKKGLAYLFLPEKHRLVKDHFFLYRKHVDLPKLSKKGFQALKNICGVVISHLDGGYFLNLTAMPKDPLNPSPSLLSKGRFREISMEAVNEVSLVFQEHLQKIGEEDTMRPTIQKQCLSNTSKFEVLFQDLKFVLGLLDQAIQAVNSNDDHIRLVPSVTRFGQKQDYPLYVGNPH